MEIELSYGLIGYVYGILYTFLTADSVLINSPISLLFNSFCTGVIYGFGYEFVGSVIDSLITYKDYKIYVIYLLAGLVSYSITKTAIQYGNKY